MVNVVGVGVWILLGDGIPELSSRVRVVSSTQGDVVALLLLSQWVPPGGVLLLGLVVRDGGDTAVLLDKGTGFEPGISNCKYTNLEKIQ